jgi:hypothetical protein
MLYINFSPAGLKYAQFTPMGPTHCPFAPFLVQYVEALLHMLTGASGWTTMGFSQAAY